MASNPAYFQQPFCQLAEGCLVAEIDPPADLSPLVAKLVYVQIEAPYVRQRVPDGCFELGVSVHPGKGILTSYVIPPHASWAHVPLSSGSTTVMARLRWGAGAHLLRLGPSELHLPPIPADLVLGTGWRNEMEQVGSGVSPQNRMMRFVRALRKLSFKAGDQRPEIARALRLIEATPSHLAVDDLAGAACLSSSQLRRVFAQEVGASPKELLRLARLWRAMDMALRQPTLAWGHVAAEAGFSDQAHLVDEFHRFTGTTPRGWYSNLFGVGATPEVTHSASRHHHLEVAQRARVRRVQALAS